MITRVDRQNLIKDFTKVFMTKKDFHERIEKLMDEIKDNIITFKDEILHETVTMREELAVTLSHRDVLEDHEVRIIKLEKKHPFKSN